MKNGFDLLDDHVVITDKDANILYANQAVEKHTGFPAHEIIGKNPADLWGGNMEREFYKKMWQCIKVEKKPFLGEVRNTRKDGVEYWQDLYISPVVDKDGQVKFFIGIEPNITERQAREKFRKDLLAGLSDQSSNPSVSIKWVLQWIFRKSPSQAEQLRTLESLYEKDKWLVDLVGDLLVISSMGSAGVGDAKEAIDIGDEIQNIIREMKSTYAHVSFEFKKERQKFPLVANKHLDLQVFSNIIDNAAKYATEINGRVAAELREENDLYIFSCENNGLSIPAEEQTKIFTQFFRAANASMEKETGTGLGLFIVKMICDTFGWSVSFQSPRSEGDGAIFFVQIPL